MNNVFTKSPSPVNVCSVCKRKGEMFSIFIDPNSDWWLKLFDSALYCPDCAKKYRETQC